MIVLPNLHQSRPASRLLMLMLRMAHYFRNARLVVQDVRDAPIASMVLQDYLQHVAGFATGPARLCSFVRACRRAPSDRLGGG